MACLCCSRAKKALACVPSKVAAIAGAVALLLVILFCCSGGDAISSNEEFMEFFDDTIKEHSGDESPIWAEMHKHRSSVQAALHGVRGGDEDVALAVAVKAGSVPALDYLVMKRGFKVDDSLLEHAVLVGNLEICRYLIDVQGCEPKEKYMSHACESGYVEICRYLRDEQGLKVTDPELMTPLLRMDESAYKMQLGMVALLTGHVGDAEELKKNHVKVAKFLVESGMDLKNSNLRNRIIQCVNKDLKEYLLSVMD